MAGARKLDIKRLTVKFVESIREPGRYSDGGRGSFGLYLLVRFRTGGDVSRSWAQRIRINGQVTNIGLGSYPVVTLAMARARALENKRIAYLGGDPRKGDQLKLVAPYEHEIAQPSHLVAPPSPTFGETADALIDLHGRDWTPRTVHKWRASLTTHAADLWDRPVGDITIADVRRALEAIWHEKPAQAKQVRLRMSKVFRRAVSDNHRVDDPAGPQILELLPKNGGVKHHAFAPHERVAATLQKIREAEGPAAARLALEFVILTACRGAEARAARWNQIDLEARVWTVPAEHAKTRREHRVPLSPEAMAVLDRARELSGGSGLIFGGSGRRQVGGTTMRMLIKAADPALTIHGFRSSFRSWCADTGVDRELAEAALAHVVAGVEGAYQRSDLYERRRPLMDAWGSYATIGR